MSDKLMINTNTQIDIEPPKSPTINIILPPPTALNNNNIAKSPVSHLNSTNLNRTATSTEPIIIANGKFIMDKKIGSGAFGEIFIGSKVNSRESVAIKRVIFFIISI